MYKVLAYLVTDVMIVISLSLTSYLFYCHFYLDTNVKTPSSLTSSTILPTRSSSGGFIGTPTPTVYPGKLSL